MTNFPFFIHSLASPLILLRFICGQQLPGQEALSQSSGRIINDILEIFAPAGGDESNTARNHQPLPYGFNKLLGRAPPSRSATVLVDEARMSPLGSPAPKTTGNSNNNHSQLPWADLAKEVMELFRAEVTTTPRPTTPSLMHNFFGIFPTPKPIEEKPLNPLIPFTFPPPFLNQNPPTVRPEPNQNPLLNQFTSIFNPVKKEEPKIDTGGQSFDRLVIREKDTELNGAEDLFASLVGGKWKEKGIQWNDGNLRLVNKKGSNLLGSELSVHDRSVDIPVQKWFDIASNLAASAYENSPHQAQRPYE